MNANEVLGIRLAHGHSRDQLLDRDRFREGLAEPEILRSEWVRRLPRLTILGLVVDLLEFLGSERPRRPLRLAAFGQLIGLNNALFLRHLTISFRVLW
jgi:hypothetical protein